MHDELTLAELDDQSVELLPDRETLFWNTYVNVWATNSSMALNAATMGSTATSTAMQAIRIG